LKQKYHKSSDGVFDLSAREYDAWYEKYPLAYESEVALLRMFIPGKGLGLEIGVGSGRFAAALGIRYGVDPSKAMLAIACQRGVRGIPALGEYLPFRSAAFDYVAIIFTLCFVRDPRAVFREARRVLKKRGKMVVGTIDKDSFLGTEYQRKKEGFYRHARLFTIKELKVFFRAAGFRNIDYGQTLAIHPKRLVTVEEPQQGVGAGSFVVMSADH
jgi:ubiquinone/menaquinone biosynthesis C-methylase UbiE